MLPLQEWYGLASRIVTRSASEDGIRYLACRSGYGFFAANRGLFGLYHYVIPDRGRPNHGQYCHGIARRGE